MRCLQASVIFVLLFAAAMPAAAHPHLFARYDVQVSHTPTGFDALHFTFRFHGLLNVFITTETRLADAPGASGNAPGASKLGPRDTLIASSELLAGVQEHPFFLYLTLDGQAMAPQQVQPVIVASAGTDTIYQYDIALPATTRRVGFALYDPSYYDSVWQSGPGAITVSSDQVACAVQVETIAKTVWGPLQAQYVSCQDKADQAPLARPAPPPLRPELDQIGGQQMLP